jgi:nucleoside-diphosphate-sugar epimerase
MKVLVTGGAGFIGSHLSEFLLEKGHKVLIIDDLSTGSIENILHLKSNPDFEYTIDTILNTPVTAELVDRSDCIFHLAAAVGVRLIVESPVQTIETNIKGTETILDLACKKKKKTIVFSTSEVYGKSRKIPFNEEDDLVMGSTTRGRWSYACSKAIDEFLALAYWKEKKLPATVIRLFNTVGPRQTGQYGMVVPTFVQQALEGKPLTVYGDGSQTRCFCHVHDVIQAIYKVSQEDKALGQVYNIGTDEEVSIMELARRVISITGSSSKIEVIPYSEAYEEGFEDMLKRRPDLAKITNLIGYKPLRDLEQIIRDVVQFEKSR